MGFSGSNEGFKCGERHQREMARGDRATEVVEAGFGLAERVVVVVFLVAGRDSRAESGTRGVSERGKSGREGQDKVVEAPNLSTTAPNSMARTEDL